MVKYSGRGVDTMGEGEKGREREKEKIRRGAAKEFVRN